MTDRMRVLASPTTSAAGTLALRLALMLLVFGVSGCERLRAEPAYNDACRALGACDAPPEPPVVVDVLDDASRGSSGSKDNFERVLEPVLSYAAERPGSIVRAWVLGKSVAETDVVGQVKSPAPARGSMKTKREAVARFVAESKSALMAGIAPALSAEPIRRSPIAAALSKIAMDDAGGLPRHVLAVTDGHEVSDLDFECGRLPSDARFLSFLHDRKLLLPGSLQGASVQFAFVELKPIPERGCPVEVAREIRIRELWTAALKSAGARLVRMNAGAPTVGDELGEAEVNKETTP